jgi:hypothetical protein
MAFTQALISVGLTTLVLSLIGASALKIFQMASDVREVRDLLKEIRRNLQNLAQPPLAQAAVSPGPGLPPGVPTPEELVRAVHAQNFSGDEFPI